MKRTDTIRMKHSWSQYVFKSSEQRLLKNFPAIRLKLRNWFKLNQRDFPWRKTEDWFQLLLAEMMLRRTRAEQVVPVYIKFLSDYNTIRSTAQLRRKELKSILYPLGLVWRAEQMYTTLEYLRDHHSRYPPKTLAEYRAIPGVGEYSGAMLANRILGQRVAPVDVNVARLHCRLLGQKPAPESRRKLHIIALANRFVQSPYAADLNLAVLDLAALVCSARKPYCSQCPVQSYCLAGELSERQI